MQDGALGIQQYPEANNLFLSGQAAMIMMGSWYTMNKIPFECICQINRLASEDLNTAICRTCRYFEDI